MASTPDGARDPRAGLVQGWTPRRLVLAGVVAAVGAGIGVVRSREDVRPARSSVERRPGEAGPEDDDTARLNAMFARGGRVVVPAGDYAVSVDANGVCLVVDVPGTQVVFETGTTIRLQPTRLGGYVVLSVEAADCSVVGGTIVGDLRRHAGNEGEWGHGVALAAGADRCLLQGVRATECWGDGFYVNGPVVDVRLVGCFADANRRQGLSVVDAVRPRVTGGSYGGTGRYGSTAPASGIDLEPNQGGAVVEALLERVTMSGSKGHGLLVSARHGPVSVTVTGCTTSHNSAAGLMFDGPGAQVVVRDSSSAANGQGLTMSTDSRGVQAVGVVTSGCTGAGFVIDGSASSLTRCVASGNGGSGFLVRRTAVGSVLASCRGASNSTRGVLPDFDIEGPYTQLVSATSAAGVGTPSSAVVLRPTARGATVSGGAWTGPYAVATVQDLRTAGDQAAPVVPP